MQTTLSLCEPCPSAGTRVIACRDLSCAWRTADAGKTFVMQRIVRNFVLADVVPDHVARPVGKWIDLNEAEFRVPLDLVSLRAIRGLIAPNGGNPCVERRKLFA